MYRTAYHSEGDGKVQMLDFDSKEQYSGWIRHTTAIKEEAANIGRRQQKGEFSDAQIKADWGKWLQMAYHYYDAWGRCRMAHDVGRAVNDARVNLMLETPIEFQYEWKFLSKK